MRVLVKVGPAVVAGGLCFAMSWYETRVGSPEFLAASAVIFVIVVGWIVDALPPFGGSDDG